MAKKTEAAKHTVMVAIENMTDSELKATIARLQKEGEIKHAKQMQRFLDIGPISERRAFWAWRNKKQWALPRAIQITPDTSESESDGIWIVTQRATKQHVMDAAEIETGHRKAILQCVLDEIGPFFTAPTTTVEEAFKAYSQSC
jgi:hypothetical protein